MELDGVHFKVQADTSQLSQADAAVDEFAKSADKAQDEVDKFGNALTAADRKAGRFIDSTGRMREANGQFVKGLEKTGSESKKTASSVAILSSELSTLDGYAKTAVISVGAMSASLGAWSITIANSVKEQQAWADATGVSLQTMQEWSAAAGAIGKDAGFIGDVFKDANEKIGDFAATGGGEAKDVFEQLNIQASELKNLSPDQQLLRIAQGLEGVATQGEKLFILESLANDASLLLPMLEDNARGLKQVTEQAREMGVVISDADAAKLREISSEWTRVTQAVQGLGNTLATEYADDVASFLGASADAITSLTGFIDDNSEAIRITSAVLAGGAAAWVTYAGMIKGATAAMTVFNAVTSANPIGIVVRVVAAAAGGLAAYIATKRDAEKVERDHTNAIYGNIDAIKAQSKEQRETAITALELKKSEIESSLLQIKTDKELYNQRVQQLANQRDLYLDNAKYVEGFNKSIINLAMSFEISDEVMAGYEQKLADVNARLAELNGTMTTGRPIVSGGVKDTKDQAASYRELLGVFNETQAAYNRYYDIVEKISESASTNTQKTELMEFAYRALQQELSNTGESYRELLGLFDEGQRSYNDYYDTVQRIADANIDAAQKTDLMAAAFRRLQEQQKEAYSLDSAPDVGESMGGLFGQFAQLDEAEASVNQWYENQLDKLNEFRELKAERTAEWDEMEAEAYRTQQEKLNQIDMARKDLQLATAESAFGSVADTMRTAFGEQSGIYKIAFAAEKAFAIARSIVAIQAGIAQAASLPFPANLAAMATVAANTASIVGNIQAVAMVGQAHDGIDSVPREGTWLLDKGERVVDRRTNEDLKDFLANGGSVNNNSSSINQNIYVTGTVDRRTSAQIAQDAARKQRIANARFGQR